MIFTLPDGLDEGKKNISRNDSNIRNNLVKFADNLPFSYFKAPKKNNSNFMKHVSNQQLNENV